MDHTESIISLLQARACGTLWRFCPRVTAGRSFALGWRISLIIPKAGR
jgi:hypothetical protein